MKKRYRKLAKRAGFILWGDEPWNKPTYGGKEVVDWSSNYDEELEEFARLVIKDYKKRNKK